MVFQRLAVNRIVELVYSLFALFIIPDVAPGVGQRGGKTDFLALFGNSYDLGLYFAAVYETPVGTFHRAAGIRLFCRGLGIFSTAAAAAGRVSSVAWLRVWLIHEIRSKTLQRFAADL